MIRPPRWSSAMLSRVLPRGTEGRSILGDRQKALGLRPGLAVS